MAKDLQLKATVDWLTTENLAAQESRNITRRSNRIKLGRITLGLIKFSSSMALFLGFASLFGFFFGCIVVSASSFFFFFPGFDGFFFGVISPNGFCLLELDPKLKPGRCVAFTSSTYAFGRHGNW